jgi:hypothetical protein
MLNGGKATLIQTSLDQSLKVQMENAEDKRRTKYYNKRPAAEKKGAVAIERSACLLTRGASRASRARIGWSRARWSVERYRMESGRVLTTTKCMAPKEACLHHCRSLCDRPTRETRWWNGAGREERERVAQK